MSTMTTAEAQLANARKMTDGQLVREYERVSANPARPPVRVAWLVVLGDELARRGLPEPWTPSRAVSHREAGQT